MAGPLSVSPMHGFLSLPKARRKCLERMKEGLVWCAPIPRSSPGYCEVSWFVSLQERHGDGTVTRLWRPPLPFVAEQLGAIAPHALAQGQPPSCLNPARAEGVDEDDGDE